MSNISRLTQLLIIAMLVFASSQVWSVKPSEDELTQAREWAARNFEHAQKIKIPVPAYIPKQLPGLTVIANNDSVQLNAHFDDPIKIRFELIEVLEEEFEALAGNTVYPQ